MQSGSAYDADFNRLYLPVMTDGKSGVVEVSLGEPGHYTPGDLHVEKVWHGVGAAHVRELAWSDSPPPPGQPVPGPGGEPSLLSIVEAAGGGFDLQWLCTTCHPAQNATVVRLDDGGRGLNVLGGKNGTTTSV